MAKKPWRQNARPGEAKGVPRLGPGNSQEQRQVQCVCEPCWNWPFPLPFTFRVTQSDQPLFLGTDYAVTMYTNGRGIFLSSEDWLFVSWVDLGMLLLQSGGMFPLFLFWMLFHFSFCNVNCSSTTDVCFYIWSKSSVTLHLSLAMYSVGMPLMTEEEGSYLMLSAY